METRTLRYFLAIAREENMTTAANTLHISQSALSRQMSDLESSLGKTLFIRTNRQTLLTEDGMRLRQRAEEIIALIEKTEMELQAQEDVISGEIHIGAGETRGFTLIAQAIRNVQHTYPQITFNVHSANALDVSERLEHGTLDFGLMFEPFNKDRYQYIDLPYVDHLGVLMRSDSPLANQEHIEQEDLPGIPLLVSSRLSPDTVLSQLSRHSIDQLNIRGTYNLLTNASYMVEEGVASALAIDGIVEAAGDSPLRFIPLHPAVEMKMIFVWKKHRLMTKAAEVFLEELRRVISAE